MAARYQVPCPHCDAHVPTEISQAGESVSCPSCGTMLEIPPYSELRRLQPAPPAPAQRRRSDWNLSQGLLFSVGLGLVLVGGGITVYLVVLQNELDTEPPQQIDYEQVSADVDSWSTVQTWRVWQEEIVTQEKPEWQPSPYVEARQTQEAYRTWSFFSGGLAALGLVGIAASFFAKRRRSAP